MKMAGESGLSSGSWGWPWWTVAGWDKGPLSYGTWTEWNGPRWPMLPLSKDHGKRRVEKRSLGINSRGFAPSLSPRAALGLCLSSRELRAATAAHRAAISLSRLGGWEWQWEWWVEELTEGTRFERRGEGRKGKVNGEFGSKQGRA